MSLRLRADVSTADTDHGTVLRKGGRWRNPYRKGISPP
jgi:hypothetical protein